MKVKDLFIIKKGKKSIETNKGIRYIQIGDLRNDNNLKYAIESNKNVVCEEKDVLIAWDGANAGTIGYNLKGILGSTLAKLSPKIDNIDTVYVGRFLQSKFNYLRSNCTGATIPHISRPSLENLKIPLPPLATQKKIAAILDQADQLRQLNKALIQKYEQLSQSLFLEMFGDPVLNPKGWEIIKLHDASHIIMGQSPKGDTYNDKGIGTPLLNGPTEFGKKYPTEKQWTIKPTKFCQKNDILFCVRGATAGKMNWADKEYCIGRGLAAIRSKGVFSDEYLYKILSNMYNIFQNTSNGSTFINITSNDLKNIKIPVTPLHLQNQFADRIKIIETQKAQAQKALDKAENLFNSLLQKAFKGELFPS